jgi:hypothetical protein
MYPRLRLTLLSAYALACALYAGLLAWFTLAERTMALRDARSSTASRRRDVLFHFAGVMMVSAG